MFYSGWSQIRTPEYFDVTPLCSGRDGGVGGSSSSDAIVKQQYFGNGISVVAWLPAAAPRSGAGASGGASLSLARGGRNSQGRRGATGVSQQFHVKTATPIAPITGMTYMECQILGSEYAHLASTTDQPVPPAAAAAPATMVAAASWQPQLTPNSSHQGSSARPRGSPTSTPPGTFMRATTTTAPTPVVAAARTETGMTTELSPASTAAVTSAGLVIGVCRRTLTTHSLPGGESHSVGLFTAQRMVHSNGRSEAEAVNMSLNGAPPLNSDGTLRNSCCCISSNSNHSVMASAMCPPSSPPATPQQQSAGNSILPPPPHINDGGEAQQSYLVAAASRRTLGVGDTVGCLVNFVECTIVFTLNGRRIAPFIANLSRRGHNADYFMAIGVQRRPAVPLVMRVILRSGVAAPGPLRRTPKRHAAVSSSSTGAAAPPGAADGVDFLVNSTPVDKPNAHTCGRNRRKKLRSESENALAASSSLASPTSPYQKLSSAAVVARAPVVFNLDDYGKEVAEHLVRTAGGYAFCGSWGEQELSDAKVAALLHQYFASRGMTQSLLTLGEELGSLYAEEAVDAADAAAAAVAAETAPCKSEAQLLSVAAKFEKENCKNNNNNNNQGNSSARPVGSDDADYNLPCRLGYPQDELYAQSLRQCEHLAHIRDLLLHARRSHPSTVASTGANTITQHEGSGAACALPLLLDSRILSGRVFVLLVEATGTSADVLWRVLAPSRAAGLAFLAQRQDILFLLKSLQVIEASVADVLERLEGGSEKHNCGAEQQQQHQQQHVQRTREDVTSTASSASSAAARAMELFTSVVVTPLSCVQNSGSNRANVSGRAESRGMRRVKKQLEREGSSLSTAPCSTSGSSTAVERLTRAECFDRFTTLAQRACEVAQRMTAADATAIDGADPSAVLERQSRGQEAVAPRHSGRARAATHNSVDESTEQRKRALLADEAELRNVLSDMIGLTALSVVPRVCAPTRTAQISMGQTLGSLASALHDAAAADTSNHLHHLHSSSSSGSNGKHNNNNNNSASTAATVHEGASEDRGCAAGLLSLVNEFLAEYHRRAWSCVHHAVEHFNELLATQVARWVREVKRKEKKLKEERLRAAAAAEAPCGECSSRGNSVSKACKEAVSVTGGVDDRDGDDGVLVPRSDTEGTAAPANDSGSNSNSSSNAEEEEEAESDRRGGVQLRPAVIPARRRVTVRAQQRPLLDPSRIITTTTVSASESRHRRAEGVPDVVIKEKKRKEALTGEEDDNDDDDGAREFHEVINATSLRAVWRRVHAVAALHPLLGIATAAFLQQMDPQLCGDGVAVASEAVKNTKKNCETPSSFMQQFDRGCKENQHQQSTRVGEDGPLPQQDVVKHSQKGARWAWEADATLLAAVRTYAQRLYKFL